MGTKITSGEQLWNHHLSQQGLLRLTHTGNLAKVLSSSSFLNQLASLFTDKAQYIYSLRWYPFDITQFTTLQFASVLQLGGHDADDGTNTAFVERFSSTISRKVKVAEIVIPRRYNNFMDFEPYTHAQIYLPFIGFYALHVNECMGKTISVSYAVDFLTGIATAYIQTEEADNGGHLLFTATGKVGIDIPLGSTNANEIAKNNFSSAMKLIASGVALVGGVASGNVVGGMIGASALTTAMSSGVNFVTGQQKHYQRGNLSGGQDALCSPRSVFVIITRPKQVEVDMNEFAKMKGRPLAETRYLGDLTGFTTVEKVHLERFNESLKSEVEEIESLLHEGVIL